MNIIDSIKAAANVKPDWDTYGSNPPNAIASENALKLGKILVDNGLEQVYVGPTGDESILIKYFLWKSEYIWNFYSDGEIGLTVKQILNNDSGLEYRRNKFFDVKAEELEKYYDLE